MALTSPGVEVTIIDQSQYLPAPTNSVPLVVLATAQNKADASGTGVAAATTAANAGKLYQVTSQRDLVNLYGTPFFYTTTNGTPIQGYELNEYGLLAAYSLLGVTNRCYVLRADIDLASLVGQTSRPTGAPANGTYWLDTTTSTWGIYEFNATTGKFTLQNPIVITDPDYISSGDGPLESIGNIGDYAVVALEPDYTPGSGAASYYFKNFTNTWVELGSNIWLESWPTAQGANSNPTLVAGDAFTINVNGNFTMSITVPDDGGGEGSVGGVAGVINDFDFEYISAGVEDGRLCIYSDNPSGTYLLFSNTNGEPLTDIGLTTSAYRQPGLAFGTSAQMPLWTSSQAAPRPTGSVWIKIGSTGNGVNPVVSQYNTTTSSWVAKNVGMYISDYAASAAMDPTGGQAIPAGTLYMQYAGPQWPIHTPYYLFEKIATGPTVVTGTVQNPTITGTTYLVVRVSIPGNSSISSVYSVSMSGVTNATQFATAWLAAGIPYTEINITTDGAIQLIHTEGGEIVLNDASDTGISTGLLEMLGFVALETDGCKYGPGISRTFSGVTQTSTTGVGDGAEFTITSNVGTYVLTTAPSVAGSGYVVDDQITISGEDLGGETTGNDLVIAVASVDGSGGITAITYVSGMPPVNLTTQLSNWYPVTYTANEGAPVVAPANNTNWFYSVVDEVDIMVNYNGNWKGYGNVNYDSSGFPQSGANTTDPNGPIISASTPTTQSDGTALVYGDLWVSTADLENYPVISRWQSVDGVDQWVLVDNTDQVSSEGIVFLDARWATNGDVNPADDPIPTIKSLLTSNYLDLDAPSASSYPTGMLLFNTRRSGYNVKQYRVNYFNSASYPDDTLPAQQDAWVTVSGNQSNGSPYMGRKAQRAMVVQSLRSVIDTNTAIRDEDNFFNLMATPAYPELQPNMVVLNADRGETAYIIGDTPMRLADSATDIQAWATNAAGATGTGEEGLVTRNSYLGLFYPSGIAPDLSGNLVAVPASHMMLRTFLRNDTIAYPWLAAAGTRRGTIDNATNIGYIDSTTGEFQTIKTRLGIRDVLYINQINPLVFFTGVGLLNYGNKTSYNSNSALDRTNVDRLVAYIRRQLTLAARPFVFEPNDPLTRQQIAGVVESLMVDLVAKRGIYDYLVVCDDSNNTPARIDRNELWIDVAIEPVKAAEFIYIPVRVLNTGELSQ